MMKILTALASLPLAMLVGVSAAAAQPPLGPPGGFPPGLEVTDVKVGDGVPVGRNDFVLVHYTGWLYDRYAGDGKGRKFDSSRDHGEPFSFQVGRGKVIRGWDFGVVGMQKGGRRMLFIPADLAYGEKGAGENIPRDAALIFDIELLDVRAVD
jgi:FKBP-type peptidyl-prolyl cis-trans isomerase FkpA